MTKSFMSAAVAACMTGILMFCSCQEDEKEISTVEPKSTKFSWTLDNGVLTISGEEAMPDFGYGNWYDYKRENIDVPWFSQSQSITTVIIENGVTSIGEYAFYYCSSLTAVTIPNSVTSIGEYAFYYCSSLTAVTIPNSVTSIGGGLLMVVVV
ncbi:hypothetical protein FACS1894195_5240 [Bacteroidia bacterium]|nr:hypothetical protein FACS1894195_5240 [Bacteroidia bacterium]